MISSIEPTLTVRDLAVMLDVDVKTIYRLVQLGDLPSFNVSVAGVPRQR